MAAASGDRLTRDAYGVLENILAVLDAQGRLRSVVRQRPVRAQPDRERARQRDCACSPRSTARPGTDELTTITSDDIRAGGRAALILCRRWWTLSSHRVSRLIAQRLFAPRPAEGRRQPLSFF